METYTQYDLRISNVRDFIINEEVGKVKLHSIESLRPLFKALELGERLQEVFIVITMDNQNNVTGLFEVFKGTLDRSVVHPRDVFQRALLMNASSIMCVHNHPAGTLKASKADIEVTEILKEAGELIGIQLIDHVIVTPNYDMISVIYDNVSYAL